MKRCTYCGKEWPDDASVCAVDGRPLQDFVPLLPTGTPLSKSFLCWKPASVSLIVLALLYWAVALLNFRLVYMLEQRGDTRNVSFLLWGSFWNLVVGGLCLSGRHLMKADSRRGYAAGALVIAAALLIVMRTWLGGLLTGRNPFPILEALLSWPWLVYAIIYALRETQREWSPN